MRKMILAAAAVMMVAALPASARGRFIAYEGNSALHSGTGGTSIARDGVEFWTSGSPARRFEILGTLTDTRANLPTAAPAVGSADVARQTRALGGDGLIVARESVRRDGGVGGWSGGDTISLSGPRMSYRTTTFVVVRYRD